MAWSFFMHGRDIPLQKIKSLKKGRSIVEIFQPVGINLVFEDVNGKLNDWTLSFSRLAAKEVIKFVDDLSAAAPDVVVDPELKIWIQKNGKDVPKK